MSKCRHGLEEGYFIPSIGSSKGVWQGSVICSKPTNSENIFICDETRCGDCIFFEPNEGVRRQTSIKRNPIESRLRHEVFKRDQFRCKECGRGNKEVVLHVDHIIPVSQGGTDELDNLQTLCSACNFAKSNRCFIGGSN